MIIGTGQPIEQDALTVLYLDVEVARMPIRGAEIGELGGAIHQLRRSGMDSATAKLLITPKRAELEDLLKAKTATV